MLKLLRFLKFKLTKQVNTILFLNIF